MKLVLVTLHIEPSARAVPLGPALLASALRNALGAAIQTRIVEGFLSTSSTQLAASILESDPQWVGFSIYVWNRDQMLETATLLKAQNPDLVLFAGGPEASADPHGILAHPAMDFVLPGEGEELVVAALGRLLQGTSAQEIARWAHPMPVRDLALLPSPYLDGTLRPEDYGGALWELSRGCPFACDFCFESKGTGGVRRVPLARVEAELDRFRESGIWEVFVLDPTFNHSRAHAKQVLKLIAEKAPDIHFFFEVRSEFLDRDMAELFAALRCTLQIGLQSAHDKVLRAIGRTFNAKDFEAKVLLLHQAGVAYGFDLIYGLPMDTLEGFRASVDFAMSLAPNHLDIFRLSVLPGTRLWETASGLGLEYPTTAPYYVKGSATFSGMDLDEAASLARGCDAFYNQGRAVPWFPMVLEALGHAPSDLFLEFDAFLDASPTQDLIESQREFIQMLFDRQEDTLMGRLAADLITYFGHSSELMEGPAQEEPLILAFHHDPWELLEQLEAGNLSLEELVFSVPARPCRVRMGLKDGIVDIQEVLGAAGSTP